MKAEKVKDVINFFKDVSKYSTENSDFKIVSFEVFEYNTYEAIQSVCSKTL